MKMKWIGLTSLLLMAACAHHALRVGCDGPLRPINPPAPLGSAAASTEILSTASATSTTGRKP
jgi:hypothetical protein